MQRPSTYGICFWAAVLLIAPASADQVPSPPKQEPITLRAVGGAFELKGTSSLDSFVFVEQCEARSGYSGSAVLLTLPLDVDAGPNDSLERATTLLRGAVAQGLEVAVEPSSEAGQVSMFYWSGQPRFRGVIESLGVKYTMFFDDGTPVRATVNLRMRESGRLQSKEEANKPSTTKKKSDCSPPQK